MHAVYTHIHEMNPANGGGEIRHAQQRQQAWEE